MKTNIIIATRNRSQLLRETLRSLEGQDLRDSNCELIVIDNGSTDETQSVLEFAREFIPLVALKQSIPGKNRALNLALESINSDLCIFTDDDVIFSQQWLKDYIDAADRWPNDSIFCGPIYPRFPASTPEWMSDPEFCFASMAFARYEPAKAEGPVKNPPFGANIAIRTELLQTQKFNEAIGPDGTNTYQMGSETDLLSRLAEMGHRFIYIPDAKVEHVITPEQTSPQWLINRAKRDGRQSGARAVHLQAPSMFSAPRFLWRQLVSELILTAVSLCKPKGKRCIARMNLAKTAATIKEIRRLRKGASSHQGSATDYQ